MSRDIDLNRYVLYKGQAYSLEQTELFADWLADLCDTAARARIIKRLVRLSDGQFGDVKPVGDGVHELRMFFGPGYRVYFVQRGVALVVLLAGGDKSTQDRDIATARMLVREL